jgi:inhibitor of KinA sporulation pathway (predicted exonuclease)
MEDMLAAQEREFADVLKSKEFRDLASEFEDVGNDPDLQDLHQQMAKYGTAFTNGSPAY